MHKVLYLVIRKWNLFFRLASLPLHTVRFNFPVNSGKPHLLPASSTRRWGDLTNGRKTSLRASVDHSSASSVNDLLPGNGYPTARWKFKGRALVHMAINNSCLS
ncbi:unnamed protein product [Cuscuta epithymum]|uniref:Uncharacterized protein n=1 Tax=Cuscuta epithymum TaxID=186058 RepID=A0AAV0CAL0_9ASTE|nr:unnamed protein product [Cuscuta epithymum]